MEQNRVILVDLMDSLVNKKIVLIGGAGFIGHHLALALKRNGASVDIIDSLTVNNLLSFSSTSIDIPNRDFYLRIINERLTQIKKHDIPLHVQDSREYHALSHLLTRINPDVIIHLAAVAHAGKANKDPNATFDHSLRTLENALDYARGFVKHFVYFSSSMVYGNFQNGYVTETDPCDPIGIYGALKFAGEKLVIAYNQVFDLPYTIIRPSALYGERCVSGRVGQVFIENAIQNLDIVIQGDGNDRLDFTYIDDLTSGIVQVLKNPNAINEILNITYGESRSISEMVKILTRHFPDVTVRYLPKDHLTPCRGTLCIAKARELIGYTPQYPLEEGYVKYISWYRSMFGHTP